FPRGNQTTRSRVSQTSRCQSSKARTGAKGQALRFLGPRGNRPLESFWLRLFFSHLPGQFVERQALSDYLTDQVAEAVGIAHGQAIVNPEGLIINITEQMKGLDAHIGSINRSLQKTPEVLHAVAVNVPIHVLREVIYDAVGIVVHAPTVAMLIRMNLASWLNATSHKRLNASLCAVRNHAGANLAAPLQDAKHSSLAACITTFLLHAGLAILVHVPRLAANPCFINFDLTTEIAAG